MLGNQCTNIEQLDYDLARVSAQLDRLNELHQIKKLALESERIEILSRKLRIAPLQADDDDERVCPDLW
jgi:hypothetical protein